MGIAQEAVVAATDLTMMINFALHCLNVSIFIYRIERKDDLIYQYFAHFLFNYIVNINIINFANYYIIKLVLAKLVMFQLKTMTNLIKR